MDILYINFVVLLLRVDGFGVIPNYVHDTKYQFYFSLYDSY